MLQSVSRPVRLSPERTYRLVGAHWYAKGLYVKQQKSAGEIQAKTLFQVKEGDFVYNRLFAWKGSFAVAAKDVDGCLVSNEFPCFIPRDTVDLKFLWFYFSRSDAWREALGLSSGSTPTSRNRLKEEQFLDMLVRLPPIDEQRHIVARIEEFAAKIAEATRLQDEITNHMDALCRALIMNPPDGVITPTVMSDLLVMRKPDVRVEATESYQFAGVYCFGRGVFAGQRKDGSEFAYRTLTRVQTGNFVYPKLMAWEGALGMVPEQCDGLYVSPEFPVFEVRQDRVFPEVLDTYFRTPSVWPDLAGVSTGTNVRRRRLHPRAFLQYKFPLPSMKVQRQFCKVRRSIKLVKRLKNESTRELSALMPSILSKAFRGEL
jgi:type I restriction enzyme S subunit